jgi:hypothetical protein
MCILDMGRWRPAKGSNRFTLENRTAVFPAKAAQKPGFACFCLPNRV